MLDFFKKQIEQKQEKLSMLKSKIDLAKETWSESSPIEENYHYKATMKKINQLQKEIGKNDLHV